MASLFRSIAAPWEAGETIRRVVFVSPGAGDGCTWFERPPGGPTTKDHSGDGVIFNL